MAVGVCICILNVSLTRNIRYKSQREDEAIDVLHNGTVQMLKNSQVGCFQYLKFISFICSICLQWESATDLGILLIKHFKDRKTPITERTISW